MTQINPIFYMVDGFRFGFFGISELQANYALLILTVFAVSFYSFNYYLIKNGIRMKS